jgi:hypothetical protein
MNSGSDNSSSQFDMQAFLWYNVLASIFYAAYNSFSYIVLLQTHQLTHSILNVFKRGFNVISAMIYFNQIISLQFILGLTASLLGLILYAINENPFIYLYNSGTKGYVLSIIIILIVLCVGYWNEYGNLTINIDKHK